MRQVCSADVQMTHMIAFWQASLYTLVCAERRSVSRVRSCLQHREFQLPKREEADWGIGEVCLEVYMTGLCHLGVLMLACGARGSDQSGLLAAMIAIRVASPGCRSIHLVWLGMLCP